MRSWEVEGNWTPDAVDSLERAIIEGDRVQLYRRGTEYVVTPREIRMDGNIENLHATTNAGDELTFRLDEIESFVVLA
ncbi:MAG TPA: hypothetical protein VFI91_13040 [Longimicrobiaceae bacterium]|nr:hypothetical protein [Longimicrobiaceae bacterium]